MHCMLIVRVNSETIATNMIEGTTDSQNDQQTETDDPCWGVSEKNALY